MVLDVCLSIKFICKLIKIEVDIMDGFGFVYSKGSVVLFMVENWIGEDVF